MNFLMKNWGVKERKESFFCKLTVKDGNVSYTDIYTITTTKIFTCAYKKINFKKMSTPSYKTFSNYQVIYYKELYLLFEKSGNIFLRASIEIGLTPPLPLFFSIAF